MTLWRFLFPHNSYDSYEISWQLFASINCNFDKFERSPTCHDCARSQGKSITRIDRMCILRHIFHLTNYATYSKTAGFSLVQIEDYLRWLSARMCLVRPGKTARLWREKEEERRVKKKIIDIGIRGKDSAGRDVGSARDRGRSLEREKENTAGAGDSKARA